MNRLTSPWLFALTAAWVPVTIANGQLNDYSDGPGYTGSVVRDLMFGPEWQSYQTLTRPTGGDVSRPVATSSARAISSSGPTTPAAPSAAPLPKQTDYALRFFGGERARETLQQLPQRPSMTAQSQVRAPGAAVAARGQKPFARATNGPTISPYLNLDRPETPEDLPNYFVFVRPQFEQFDVNRRQQRELQRLDREVRTAAYGTAAAPRSAMPTTGHGTRFGDTGRFYGGWRR